MQTKHQIQQLLAEEGVGPNKQLGQHFLIDLNLMKLLIDSARITKDDIVLEVGCGTGSLTEGLAEKAGMIIAVEVDPTLAKIANKQLKEKANVTIINTDILKNKHTISDAITSSIESALKQAKGRFLLVSNLPYNCACAVMMNLVTGPTIADGMYVTIQKEVAERMTAEADSEHYGTLSIFLAVTGEVKTIRTLKPMVFWPQPQVNSAMISFVRDRQKTGSIESMEIFAEVVGLFMQHRRKMLKACTKLAKGKLKGIKDWTKVFEISAVNPQGRPENLRPDDYVTIANICHKQLIPE